MKIWAAALLCLLSAGYSHGAQRDDAQGLYRVVWSDGEKHDTIFGIVRNLDEQWAMTNEKGIIKSRLWETEKSTLIDAMGKPIADASFCLGARGAATDIFCVTKPGITARFESHDFLARSGDVITTTDYLFYLEMSGVFNLEKVSDAVPIPPFDDAELLKNAEAGDAEAQYDVGAYYLRRTQEGDRESASAKLAITWLSKSAAQKNRDALNALAYAHQKGAGVTQSPDLSLKYYQMAADKGSTKAMKSLGTMFLEGQGVSRDEERGARWILEAAEHDDASAQNELIVLYSTGKGLPQDAARALAWAQKSLERKDDGYRGYLAMYNLGEMYANGNGVPCHPKKAVYWMRKAARAGVVDAMTALGGYYKNGLGDMPPDPVLAVAWLRLAKDSGVDQNVLDDLEMLKAGLTEAQAHAAEKVYRQLDRGEEEPEPEPK